MALRRTDASDEGDRSDSENDFSSDSESSVAEKLCEKPVSAFLQHISCSSNRDKCFGGLKRSSSWNAL